MPSWWFSLALLLFSSLLCSAIATRPVACSKAPLSLLAQVAADGCRRGVVQGSEAGQNSLLQWEVLRGVGAGSSEWLVRESVGWDFLQCSEDLVLELCKRDVRLEGVGNRRRRSCGGLGAELGTGLSWAPVMLCGGNHCTSHGDCPLPARPGASPPCLQSGPSAISPMGVGHFSWQYHIVSAPVQTH